MLTIATYASIMLTTLGVLNTITHCLWNVIDAQAIFLLYIYIYTSATKLAFKINHVKSIRWTSLIGSQSKIHTILVMLCVNSCHNYVNINTILNIQLDNTTTILTTYQQIPHHNPHLNVCNPNYWTHHSKSLIPFHTPWTIRLIFSERLILTVYLLSIMCNMADAVARDVSNINIK